MNDMKFYRELIKRQFEGFFGWGFSLCEKDSWISTSIMNEEGTETDLGMGCIVGDEWVTFIAEARIYKGKEKKVTEALKNKELFGEWTRTKDKVGVTLKISKETFLLNATNIFEDGIRPIADVLFLAIE